MPFGEAYDWTTLRERSVIARQLGMDDQGGSGLVAEFYALVQHCQDVLGLINRVEARKQGASFVNRGCMAFFHISRFTRGGVTYGEGRDAQLTLGFTAVARLAPRPAWSHRVKALRKLVGRVPELLAKIVDSDENGLGAPYYRGDLVRDLTEHQDQLDYYGTNEVHALLMHWSQARFGSYLPSSRRSKDYLSAAPCGHLTRGMAVGRDLTFDQCALDGRARWVTVPRKDWAPKGWAREHEPVTVLSGIPYHTVGELVRTVELVRRHLQAELRLPYLIPTSGSSMAVELMDGREARKRAKRLSIWEDVPDRLDHRDPDAMGRLIRMVEEGTDPAGVVSNDTDDAMEVVIATEGVEDDDGSLHPYVTVLGEPRRGVSVATLHSVRAAQRSLLAMKGLGTRWAGSPSGGQKRKQTAAPRGLVHVLSRREGSLSLEGFHGYFLSFLGKSFVGEGRSDSGVGQPLRGSSYDKELLLVGRLIEEKGWVTQTRLERAIPSFKKLYRQLGPLFTDLAGLDEHPWPRYVRDGVLRIMSGFLPLDPGGRHGYVHVSWSSLELAIDAARDENVPSGYTHTKSHMPVTFVLSMLQNL